MNRVMLNITLPRELKAEVLKTTLPDGVAWSHVFRLVMLSAVAEKKKWSDERFKQEASKLPNYEKVREWLRERYHDYLE